MAKTFARIFKSNKDSNELLAIIGSQEAQTKVGLHVPTSVASIDVAAADLKNWKPLVARVFKGIVNERELTLIPDKVKSFDGIEIATTELQSFKLDDFGPDFKLKELNVKANTPLRVFAYDMTDPEISIIHEENKARTKYYVEPDYFEWIQRNLLNKLIKGIALIGKPGTGKSTDAIAAVKSLGGICLTKQLSAGLMENDVFVNVKPNGALTKFTDKIARGEKLTESEAETYELLVKSSAGFIEVEEIIMLAIRLNCPALLDEAAYANAALLSKFNVLTDGTVSFLYNGVSYKLPDNFFLFFTWNPGDEGTNDIPNALKTRFPVFIVPPLDVRTHRERVQSFSKSELGIEELNPVFIDALFHFGNKIEQDQNKMKHNGGSFTLRATQMLCATIFHKKLSKKEFMFELKSKFVNPLWGTNFENTFAIDDMLNNSEYKPSIDGLYKAYESSAVGLESDDKPKKLPSLASLFKLAETEEEISIEGLTDAVDELDDYFSDSEVE